MATIQEKKGEMDFKKSKYQQPYLTYEEQIAIVEGDDWEQKKLLAERHDLCEVTQLRLVQTSDFRIMASLAINTNVKEVWELCSVHCASVREACKKNPYFGEILAVD